MELEELNWGEVPQHISVLTHEDGTVNFVINLRVLGENFRWCFQGDECDITGYVTNTDEGWSKDWRLLERPITEQSPTQGNTSAAMEWLNKFLTVAIASPTNESICVAFNNQLCLETMHGNIYDTQNIVDSINNRYSQLIEQANKSKREELLAEIVKAKEVYEKLVGELNELEGK